MKTVSVDELRADLEAMCNSISAHRPLDQDLVRRVQERAEETRAELRLKGQTNVAVELLRESRDE